MSWDDIGGWIATWDWGTFPEYLGALGTVGAVGTALWIARRDGKRLEDEQTAAAEDRKAAASERAAAAEERDLHLQEIHAEREERDRRVASRVMLSIGSKNQYSINPPDDALALSDMTLRVVNASDYPIYHPTLALKFDNEAFPREIGGWFSIEPGESVDHDIPEWTYQQLYSVDLYFQDGKSCWKRSLIGALEKVSGEEMGAALGIRKRPDGTGWHWPRTQMDAEGDRSSTTT